MQKTWPAVIGVLLLSACAPFGKSTDPSASNIASDKMTSPSPGSGNSPPNAPHEPNPPPTGSSNPPPQSFPETARKFDRPWEQRDPVIVIDAYQGNAIDWATMAKDARVAGVIHRSSIGLTEDTLYQSRKLTAISRGYLWGAYHLGRSGDPIEQARFFLKVLGDSRDTLMALDLEDTSSSSMMSVSNAIKFMEYIYQQTGRNPVVYANHSVTQALNAAVSNLTVFKNSKLWYARFRSDIPDFPKGVWSTYFLWQFSSEINCSRTGACLYNVPGTSFDMDVNVHYGSRAALAAQWTQ